MQPDERKPLSTPPLSNAAVFILTLFQCKTSYVTYACFFPIGLICQFLSRIHSTHVRIAIGSSYIYGGKTAVVKVVQLSTSLRSLVSADIACVCIYECFFCDISSFVFCTFFNNRTSLLYSCIAKGPCHPLICF